MDPPRQARGDQYDRLLQWQQGRPDQLSARHPEPESLLPAAYPHGSPTELDVAGSGCNERTEPEEAGRPDVDGLQEVEGIACLRLGWLRQRVAGVRQHA